MGKPGRDDLCPCESGRKYKHCHGGVHKVETVESDITAEFRKHRKDYIAQSFSGPRPIAADHQGYTFRAIGNRLYYRKSHTTYIDFLLDLIEFAFGPKWHSNQVALPEQGRHLVMQWMGSWYRHCEANRPQNVAENSVFRCAPTGDGQALLTLADDLYKLQVARSLPSKLMHRLRIPELFQGARYEVQVASIFLRSGFDIDWQEDNAEKHCEFYAVQKHTRMRVAVEAKSRKCPGVLGEAGVFSRDHPMGVATLHEKARLQNPGYCPFCVFVDVNWPCHPELPKFQKTWMAEVFELAKKHVPSPQNPSDVSLSVFTNYSWHYQGTHDAVPHETLVSWPLNCTYPMDDLTRTALGNSILKYGVDIVESATPMIHDQVLEQIASLTEPSS